MLAIFKRELKAYFQTPLGYIFMSLFLLIAGILFVLGNKAVEGWDGLQTRPTRHLCLTVPGARTPVAARGR